MWNGKRLSVVLPLTALLGLYGCDAGDAPSGTAKTEMETAKPMTEQAATMVEQAAEEMADAAEQAPDMVEAAKGQAAEAAASLLLIDASSLDSFKSSLSTMKGSLDHAGQQQLSSALAGLASSAAPTDAGGLLGAAKNVAGSGSAEDTIYSAFGSKLNGLSFEQLLAFAKNLG
ncbi:MAG: hypothetical protein HQ511_01070 [Rhodospirillales bacterium]|nr:hypothetical protein [Rhodospirillales bacterium]